MPEGMAAAITEKPQRAPSFECADVASLVRWQGLMYLVGGRALNRPNWRAMAVGATSVVASYTGCGLESRLPHLVMVLATRPW